MRPLFIERITLPFNKGLEYLQSAQQSIMGNDDDDDDDDDGDGDDDDDDDNTGYLCLLENPHHGETNVKCHFLASVAACNLRLT